MNDKVVKVGKIKENISKYLFLFGVLLIFFPFVAKMVSYINQTKLVQKYDNTPKTTQEIMDKKDVSTKYNEEIKEDFRVLNLDQNAPEMAKNVYDYFQVGEVIGTLKISKIDTILPIFESIDSNNLQKGVCLMQGTSFPNGEIGTHSVLAGHSGLTSAKILDDADQLVIGDRFEIEYLGDTNTYEVINIEIVLPNQTENLKIQEDETLVTLCTCTPKYLNTHRLLITAKKVENIIEIDDEKIENVYVRFIKINYAYVGIILLLFLMYICGNLLINKTTRRG